jgi:tRNA U34 5-carboxymethylaminomethyl modifying GTPase MnmE/TrmE
MSERIIEQLAGLEDTIAKYDGFVVEEAGRIRQDLNVPPVESLREHLAALDEERRLLNIGIIGRVKAGKSSLLNAVLFDGEDILPKAATPMTASLTIITHGKEFAATVEYFTPEDIALIEKEHHGFADVREKTIQRIRKKIEERKRNAIDKHRPFYGGEKGVPEGGDGEKARRQADRELREHRWSASFDQYERMERSGHLEEMKTRRVSEERITVANLGDLEGELSQYVGSTGARMPFTKSVRLELPRDSLRDIQVVDTPGINDPVISREQRTQDYLKKCDVVLIVSSAGQFLSREDTNLMDRVTAREGVRELYIVATQADSQFHGDVLERSGGDLKRALDMIHGDLGRHAAETLNSLKYDSPEVGNAFDTLIEGGAARVMVTSAICHAMSLRFGQRQGWNDGMNNAWDNLARNYPDHFDSDAGAEAALEMLANIGVVRDGLDAARRGKDRIIEEKRKNYLQGQEKTVRDFRLRLRKGIEEQVDLVRKTDMAQVREQKKANENLLVAGSEAVDGAFEDSLDRFQSDLRETVMSRAQTLFAESKRETEDARKETTETRTVRYEKSGILSWIARKLDLGGYETRTEYETVTTVRANTVKSSINDLVDELQEELTRAVDKAKRDWKKNVQREVVVELEKAVADAGQFYAMLTKALRSCINSMILPDMEIDYPFRNDESGVLKDSSAERFMEKVNSYFGELRSHYRKQVDRFIKEIVRSASEKQLSDLIFTDIRGQLENLERDIKSKESTLKQLDRCLGELNKLGGD